MTTDELERQLKRCVRRPGYAIFTVFLGAWAESTVASLDDAAGKGALILYVHDGPADPLSAGHDPLFFHTPADEGALNAMLPRLFDAFAIEEGFQINTVTQKGYEKLQEWIVPVFHRILSDVKFSRHRGLLHLRCMLRNIPLMGGEKVVTLKQRGRKAAALICGAGPSLESQFDVIREFRDRFWLISVGHAAGRLYDAGIMPDLIVEIDSECGRNWRAVRSFTCPLAAVPIVDPTVSGLFQRLAWYGEPDRENNHFLRMLQLRPEPAAVSCGVIITAIDLAFKIGFDFVGIIGSDFCLASDGSMYGDAENMVDGNTLLPGNLGGSVVSLPALTGIKTALEGYIAANRRTLYNCTNGGAVIDGVRWLPLPEFSGFAGASPQMEIHSVPQIPAMRMLNQAWNDLVTMGQRDEVGSWIIDRIHGFAAQVAADALQPEKLGSLADALLIDINRDIEGDTGSPIAGPYRFAAFRRHAIDAVRISNPEYAQWLERPEAHTADPRFVVRSWLETLPDVRIAATGQALTQGDNREHHAHESLEHFLSGADYDRQKHLLVFVAPGDWQEVVQFARSRPGVPFIVLDPFPELFSRIIEYSLFCHYFPDDALLIGVNSELLRWKRLYHGGCRDARRAGKEILLRVSPVLAGYPEVAALLAEMST